MTKRYIDCTLSIVASNAWHEFPRRLVFGGREPGIKIEPMATLQEHRVLSHSLQLTTQCFTHIESKVHHFEGGRTIDDVPLEWFINEGVVIDMMRKEAGEGVSAADLEKAKVDVREGDTLIIRTGWTDKCFGTKQFWERMIHLKEDAADWIVSKKPRALMQDFMTDIPPVRTCDHCGSLLPASAEDCRDDRLHRLPGLVPRRTPCHDKFLGQDMLLIEWCTNLGAIAKPRVQVIALPLKIKGTEGAPARVVVVEDDWNIRNYENKARENSLRCRCVMYR